MPLPKNFRNYQAYLAKKKRGPVKAFFHITKNENVPAIEQQGLLANHPNANINSAFQPFRKHGSKGGGVWVTTEPSAFPVYGTTIGGKFDDGSARADALSTFKIEVPVPELPKMLAVQDPYGKNILRKGNDPRAIEPFSTWLGNDVPTTVFLNDMKPEWLKNLGYVEERAPIHRLLDTHPEISEIRSGWDILQEANGLSWLRALSKGDVRDYSGLTGHGHGFGTYDKSPQRFVVDYLDRNRPIEHRMPRLPKPFSVGVMARMQGASDGPQYDKAISFKRFKQLKALGALDTALDLMAQNEPKRYSVDFIPAVRWTKHYLPYVKPGESIQDRRRYEFAPGAISRGISGSGLPPLKDRQFNWDTYRQSIAAGNTPQAAAERARPAVVLNWDNVGYHNVRGYSPKVIEYLPLNYGAISRGTDDYELAVASDQRAQRQAAAAYIRSKRNAARKYLVRGLGRQPTAEELDAWTRAGIFNDIEAGNLHNALPVLSTYADKANWDLADQISEELFKRMGK